MVDWFILKYIYTKILIYCLYLYTCTCSLNLKVPDISFQPLSIYAGRPN